MVMLITLACMCTTCFVSGYFFRKFDDLDKQKETK
jgi:hypothetical protein